MDPIFLPATTFAAIWTGGILFALTIAIGMIRKREKISRGDGGDNHFAKRQRGHANAVEQIPITLILLALAELQGGPVWLVWSIAIGLGFGRSCHAIQFWFKGAPFILRPVGVTVTLGAQLAALVWLVAVFF
ncbi:MAG: glutathione S-transferase [Alphaproteobacteria bacterium]|nr:glutathione S-transferase [Alphaproteobacteria bacterium]